MRGLDMWSVTEAYRAALLAPTRRWATKIEVLYGTEVVTTLNTLVTGYIGLDNVSVRRECHITIVDADGTLTPALATDLLAPKGTEIRIYRGLWVAGMYEWVPLGVFTIIEPEVRSNEAGTQIDLKGFDRVDHLRAVRFENPFVVTDGTLLHVAMAAIVVQQYPSVQLRVTPSTYTVPEIVFDRLTSPWDALRTLMDAGNYNGYFDQLGTFVIEPYTQYETGITYDSGQPTSLLMGTSASWDSSAAYSGVIARAEHPGADPIRVEIWDTDPTSPTYSLGPFGRRPYGYYTEGLTDVGQLTAVAQALFDAKTHMVQEIEIYTRGGPQHDVDDVIYVDDPRSKIRGLYAVVSATVPIVNEQGAHVRLRCRTAA